MLTLIGTSTNLLASDISARLGEEYPELHRFSMFEFTQLGVLVVIAGRLYLVFISHYLLSERVPPRTDYLEEYEVGDYVADVSVVPDSPQETKVRDMKPEKKKNEDTFVDVLDVLLRDGAIVRVDVIVSVAEIPLIGIKLTAAIAGMETMTDYGLFGEWDTDRRARAVERRQYNRQKR